MAGIYFDARINGEQLQRDIADINKQLKNLTTDVEKTGRGIDSTFKNLGGLLAGYFTFNFAGNMVKQIAQVRGEFQQLEVAFETMIGNKAKADALMADVVRMASTTPFELKEVASGAKSLLAFGVETENIIPTLKSLGDVSAGLSVPIERLILNFGQIKTQAKLTGKELRDFNVAGVPIIAELAKNLGKSEQAIQDMVSAGNIGFQEVADAFKSMSSEGGRFANLMDKQAKTIIGLQSNLRDAIDQMFNSIGQSQEGAISSVIKTAISLVENYEKVIDILKVLVVTYGAYKAALMTVAAWQAISTKYAVMDIATKKLQVNATLEAALAQKGLNAAMKLNPYVLAAAGIAAFVTILTTSIKKKREAAEAAAEFADSLETETYNVNKAFDAIKNTTEGTKERADAIKAVNQQYGTYLPAMLTEASTLDQVAEAQRGVTNAIIETISTRNKEAMLKPVQDKLNDAIADYKGKVANLMDDMVSGIQKGQFEGQMDTLFKNITERAKNGATASIEEISRAITTIYKNVTGGNYIYADVADRLAMELNKAAFAQKNLEDATVSLNEQTKAYLRTLGLTDQQIGTTSEQISKTVSQQIADTTKAITDAQAELNRLRQPNSVATEEQIKAQETIIKDLRGKLETLTGISRKAANEQAKIEEEKLKAQKELSDKLIELETQTQAAKIAIMEDGTRKQIAEIDLQLKQEIAAIERQRQELLTAAKGSTDYDAQAKVINTNSDALLTAVQTKAAQERVKIEQESAAKVKELWKVVTDEFSSDRERELTSVREYYAERIAEAQKAADKELEINLRSAQQYAEQKIDQQYYADVLEAESDVIREKMKLREKDFADSESYRKAEYNAIVKWAQKQIAFYQKLGGKESEGPIKALLEFMNGLKQSSDESEGALGKIEQGFMRIRRAIDYVDEGLGKSLDSMFEIGKATEKLNSLLSVEGKKDWFGISMVGADIIMGVFDMMSSTISETIGSSQTMAQKLDKINNTLSMQQQILSNISGNDYWALMTKQVDEYDKKVKLSTQAIIANMNTFEFKALNLGKDIPSDIINWDLYEILEAHNKGIITLTQTQLNYLNEGIDAMTAQMDLMETSWEKITGTTRDSIADGIIEGFRDGFDSAEDFADNLEELLKKAILTAVKTDIMKGPLTQWYQQLGELSKDGLTDDELKILKDSWDKLIAASKQIYDDIEKATGVQLEIKPEDETVSDRNKLTGAVKGITEETAGIIAGQFYAMRENLLAIKSDTRLIRELIPLDLTYSFVTIRDNAVRMADTLGIMNTTQQQMQDTALNQLASINETVGHLAQIEKNTRNNEKLNSIDARLEEMNRNIKNL